MPRIDKSKALEAAQKHLAKGNLPKALEEYRKILSADRRNSTIRLKIAELLERTGDREGAAIEYRRVAREFKTGGFYSKACALLGRVASLEPASADAHLELAELNQKLGRVAEALRHYQLATDVVDRGRDKRHSIDILKRIAEVGAPNLDRSLEVASLYYKEGYEQEGFQQFCHATADLDMTSDELLEITLRMRQAWPGDLRLKAHMGEIHLARSEPKAAVPLFEEIVAESRNARHLVLLAEAKAQDSALEDAKQLLQEAIALYDADWDIEKRREVSARLIEISAALLESTTGEILLTEVDEERLEGERRYAVPQEGGLRGISPEDELEGISPEAVLQGPAEDLDMLLTEADALLAMGRREAAIEVLERAAALHPGESAPPLRLQTIRGGNAAEPAPGALRAPEGRRAGDDAPAGNAPAQTPGDLEIQIVIDEAEIAEGTRTAVNDAGAGSPAPAVTGPETEAVGAPKPGADATAAVASFRSALTGLPIRDLFLDRVERALARSGRIRTYTFAVLVLDIDRFKRINDAFGLARGDELLVAVAQRLEQCLRKSDTAAYLGGDEFGVLLENIRDARAAMRLAGKIGRRLGSPFVLDGREVELTASIGIALSTTGYERPEALLQDAGAAMFRAKGKGQGLAELFDESLRSRATAVLQLETDLRRAVEAGEFLIHYQPIVAPGSGRVAGFEALARWQHPEGNLIAPGDFIPMAEEIALIGPIERWLIGEACRRLREWQDGRDGGSALTMSVNVSGKHLAQPNFVAHLEEALSESPVEPGTLILEVTEGALIENAESLPALFERLGALRVGLSVDDFGSGLSSIALLQRHPFASLKIDACAAGEDLGDAGMIRALVGLARVLGAASVVKGVENERQLAVLRELGCDLAQGHLFSRAVEEGEARGLVGRTLPR